MNSSKEVNILLIGVGLYAKSCYLKHFLKNSYSNARIVACLDLIEQSTIVTQFLAEFPIHTRPDSYFLTKQTKSNFEPVLKSIIKKHQINSVIISTPPENRLQYLLWALKNDLHILSDKPLTAPPNCSVDETATDQLMSDYLEVLEAYQKASEINPFLVFDLMVQRRCHPLYKLIRQKLVEVSEYTGCPLTHFQLTHADGQWRLPNEIVEIDYHGFTNGNGKNSHSGYHFFDVAAQSINLTFEAANKKIDQVRSYSTGVFPTDLSSVLTQQDYSKIFGSKFYESNRYTEIEYQEQTKNYGEIDSVSNIAFLSKGKVMTTGSMNLLHNSLSTRSWLNPNLEDLYRSNGRTRQELHYYVQGPFQSISVVGLRGSTKVQDENSIIQNSARDAIELHIFRNAGINSSWEVYEKITINDLIPELKNQDAHMGYARDLVIKEFITNILLEIPQANRSSHLSDHNHSIIIMSSVCKSLATSMPITLDYNI
jgi:hypothetical protein